MYNITKCEEVFFTGLTEQQQRIYALSDTQLRKLHAIDDYCVNEFINAALLLNALHAAHETYNIMTEKYCLRTENEDVDNLLGEAFNCSITIGTQSAVIPLCYMDSCDALYVYLAHVKMNGFNIMVDSVKIDDLIGCL